MADGFIQMKAKAKGVANPRSVYMQSVEAVFWFCDPQIKEIHVQSADAVFFKVFLI